MERRTDDADSSPARDCAWYVAAIDSAAAAESYYDMVLAIHDALSHDMYDEMRADMNSLERSIIWAFDYVPAVGQRSAKLLPRRYLGDGETDPPKVRSLSAQLVSHWRDLLSLVHAAPARARLAHLLFQVGGSGARELAKTAVDAYIDAANNWSRKADVTDALRIASSIAESINDANRTFKALSSLIDAATSALDDHPPQPGIVLHALRHASVAPQSLDHLDVIVERAAVELPTPRDRDSALQILLDRCTDDEARSAIWRRRVEAYLSSAENGESPMHQMLLRRDALRLADQSGDPLLSEQAAAALQQSRDVDLGRERVRVSSELYQQLHDEYRDSFVAGETWMQALVSFANAGPLSGEVDANRRIVDEVRSNAPLLALFRVEVTGPDNLPYYTAHSEEERREHDLIQHETQLILSQLDPLYAALDLIPTRFAWPSTAELAGFLDQWPGLHRSALKGVVNALERFWAGDFEGAIYTLVPRIETLVRELLLGSDYGMYVLQRTHRPGQFPALGPMLDALPGRFDVSESRMRFLRIVLVESGGLNIRNTLAHGIHQYDHYGLAALLIHTVLYIATLGTSTVTD